MASPGRADLTASDLEGLAARLGSSLSRVDAVAWGDAAATHRLELADGRILASRAIGGQAPLKTARRQAAVMVRLIETGLPVPAPTVIDAAPRAWLVTPWVDGETGATWLDTPERARVLARSAGRLAARLRHVDPAHLGLDGSGSTGPAAAVQASRWLRAAEGDLSSATTAAVADAIGWLETTTPWSPTFVHGDWAPINVIVDRDGSIVAVLDVEHATIGSPLADAAWWGWVVRHHHPEAWAASWETFCQAAGVDAGPGGADARGLEATRLVRLLRAVAEARDASTRTRWITRLDEAAGW